MEKQYAVIPKPNLVVPKAGYFEITSHTRIVYHPDNLENAAFLQNILSIPTGYQVNISTQLGDEENNIHLFLDNSSDLPDSEGYHLKVNPDAIIITAKTTTGIFYGIQSLRQLLPPEIESKKFVSGIKWFVPCCEIRDYPRFPWRGFMLDEGRHFFGIQSIQRTIDLLALQKLNILHWHLTEDQGWRIEIKAYPKLTEIGSQRSGTATSLMDMFTGKHDNKPQSGYYTQEEIHEVISYARQRHITIVPEIEIPGHSMAALTAYPELSCTGGPFSMPTRFGIFKDIYCAGKENTYQFLKAVLDEILALFPSTIIHIGGDEAPSVRWKACPDCRVRIQRLGLSGVGGLRADFLNGIINYLYQQGRRAMGWNEIIHGDLNPGVIIQYWMGNKKSLVEAMKKGNQVIISAFLETYLDHSYTLTPLHRSYIFEPVLDDLKDYRGNILGLEAPLWTEWVPNQARLDYQVFPRLTAYAETGWTLPGMKNYPDFRNRLQKFSRRLELLGVRYAEPRVWDPSKLKQWLGLFTIAQAQRKTSS